ncbi:MAG: hypothetical protein ACLR4N_00465 [Mediterraneibacter faecis]
MKNKEMKVKAMSMAVAMSMVVGLCPSTIFAATGSQTAKDGTYTKTAHVARTAEDDENEDEWNEYDVEVSLKVEDGKFSEPSLSTQRKDITRRVIPILQKLFQNRKESRKCL